MRGVAWKTEGLWIEFPSRVCAKDEVYEQDIKPITVPPWALIWAAIIWVKMKNDAYLAS